MIFRTALFIVSCAVFLTPVLVLANEISTETEDIIFEVKIKGVDELQLYKVLEIKKLRLNTNYLTEKEKKTNRSYYTWQQKRHSTFRFRQTYRYEYDSGGRVVKVYRRDY